MSTKFDSAIQQAVARVANQIAAAVRRDIVAEIQRVVAGRTAVGTKPAATSSRRPRRGVADADIKRVLDYIARNPGKRTEEIGKGIGADAKPALAKLRAEKKVKTRGQKRATTYTVA
jgi:hypothetical protein